MSEENSVNLADSIKGLSWDSHGLIPVVAQDADGTVLMLAYANDPALRKTLETGQAHYYSRSRNRIWRKGESSGNVQEVLAVHVDCDRDAVLYQVRRAGPACHTGHETCFFRELGFSEGHTERSTGSSTVLNELWQVIEERKRHPREGSYTCQLMKAGWHRLARKLGEEAVETITARENDLAGEAADLLYHLLVYLSACDVGLDEVMAVLRERRGQTS